MCYFTAIHLSWRSRQGLQLHLVYNSIRDVENKTWKQEWMVSKVIYLKKQEKDSKSSSYVPEENAWILLWLLGRLFSLNGLKKVLPVARNDFWFLRQPGNCSGRINRRFLPLSFPLLFLRDFFHDHLSAVLLGNGFACFLQLDRTWKFYNNLFSLLPCSRLDVLAAILSEKFGLKTTNGALHQFIY